MPDHDTHDHTGVPGVTGTPTDILDIPTAEMDSSLVLAPDGMGGVEFRAEAGGGGLDMDRYLDNSSHANYTTTSGSFVDLDSASDLTLTTGAHRVLLGFTCMAGNGGGNTTAFDFAVDGTRQGNTLGLTGTNNTTDSVGMTYLTDVLSAGSHTFKVQWRTTSSSTGTVFANTTGLAVHFYAIEQAA